MPVRSNELIDNTPLVSIGMPVFNGEKYIEEAIRSLLEQSYRNFELIISDNASNDATPDLCRVYAESDSRIRYICQIENIGPLANFQFVLSEASGQYFMWAAADDVWSNNWLEDLIATIVSSKSSAAFGRIQVIDDNSEPALHVANYKKFKYMECTLFRRIKYFLQFEGEGKANPIYSLWDINSISGLHILEYKYDFIIIFDLLKTCNIANTSSAILYKRIHTDCASREIANDTKSYGLFSFVTRYINPFPRGAIFGYIYSLNVLEYFFILFIPLKFMIAYKSIIISKLKLDQY